MKMVTALSVWTVNDTRPGFPVEVPAAQYDELLKMGCIAPLGSAPAPAATDKTPSRIDRLVEMIEAFDPEDKECWTADGKPTVDAFQDLFDEDVTAAERDEAYERFSAAKE